MKFRKRKMILTLLLTGYISASHQRQESSVIDEDLKEDVDRTLKLWTRDFNRCKEWLKASLEDFKDPKKLISMPENTKRNIEQLARRASKSVDSLIKMRFDKKKKAEMSEKLKQLKDPTLGQRFTAVKKLERDVRNDQEKLKKKYKEHFKTELV